MEATTIGVLPGDSSEITRKLCELVGRNTTLDQQAAILRELFAWADANRGRGIARNRVLNVGNCVRIAGDRAPYTPPKGEYALTSLLSAPAHAPAPAPSFQPSVPSAPVQPAVPAAPAAQASTAVEGTILAPKAFRSGERKLPVLSFDDLSTAREHYLDQYVTLGQHPFVRYARVAGQLYVFAGSCRGLLPEGENKGKVANVNFRVRGRTTADLRAQSSSRELLGGMVFWVWSFPWQDGETVRFWMNLSDPAVGKGKDHPEGTVRLVLSHDGFSYAGT